MNTKNALVSKTNSVVEQSTQSWQAGRAHRLLYARDVVILLADSQTTV